VLSIAEFNAAASAHNRRMVVAAGGAVAGMLACFGLAGLSRQALLGSLSIRLGEMGAEALFVVVPFLAILVFLAAMWLGYRQGNRDGRLLCPHCHTLLVQHQHLVVATRNCVQCGRRVLAEPA
jgi:nitrate reductase gamma subunit